ncbi:MAG: Peptide deformylase [Candidatus Woesebacteria bacterium GW2011_GWB1_43_14]|uniref:Peptide deformylase n=1 Tax=Candidatus Woesebacteria bacterium GW2011_GWB1_43_14 TaxID=1618578 RepID=A0A0G1DGW6_9BACT|nr:MAG: Peptide deformylase [Candidatus Woesebacteria bacterium GW2011_GWA1_39_11b]KKS77753.1 MAG: peptide deformylase [Candidatus Woesebacteria bacterium GW2011_GWC1_42_9]KKS96939.1 MAG: Peptide deformylase [Candidatus Woesebacteria bacterium GW2011_GWB1_43_14]
MIKKIVDVKDPILRAKAKPVAKIDAKIKKLIQDMKDTLYSQDDPEGVGLAAPQVGKSLQIFITNYEGKKITVINPKVLNTGKSEKIKLSEKVLEGCLSLPHYYGPLSRARTIKIKYLDENRNTQVKEFRDFMAQIIQHEIDHLKGVLFIDKLIAEKEPLYKFDGEDWEEVEL